MRITFQAKIPTINDVLDGRVNGKSQGGNPEGPSRYLLAHSRGPSMNSPPNFVNHTSFALGGQMRESVRRQLNEGGAMRASYF